MLCSTSAAAHSTSNNASVSWCPWRRIFWYHTYVVLNLPRACGTVSRGKKRYACRYTLSAVRHSGQSSTTRRARAGQRCPCTGAWSPTRRASTPSSCSRRGAPLRRTLRIDGTRPVCSRCRPYEPTHGDEHIAVGEDARLLPGLCGEDAGAIRPRLPPVCVQLSHSGLPHPHKVRPASTRPLCCSCTSSTRCCAASAAWSSASVRRSLCTTCGTASSSSARATTWTRSWPRRVAISMYSRCARIKGFFITYTQASSRRVLSAWLLVAARARAVCSLICYATVRCDVSRVFDFSATLRCEHNR